MNITWTRHDYAPHVIYIDVDGVSVGYVGRNTDGWYAKHGTVTRMVRGLATEDNARAALVRMVMHPEEAP